MKNIFLKIYIFFIDIWNNKSLLVDLAKNDFKSRYIGNILGVFWAFLQPTALIIIFWFVFQVGFKSKPTENAPFILWLMAGLVPWFFISEALLNATRSILDNSFLVKKVVFRVSLLPLVKIISAFIIHLFFVLFVLCIFIYYQYYPNIYWIQLLYYILCSIVFVLALSWITSSIIIFFRDLGEVIAMVLQIFFWVTPIIWSPNIIPKEYLAYIQLNPLYYIIEGYRDTLIHNKWFWENDLTLYFWFVCIILIILAVFTFKKLRPHFADVL